MKRMCCQCGAIFDAPDGISYCGLNCAFAENDLCEESAQAFNDMSVELEVIKAERDALRDELVAIKAAQMNAQRTAYYFYN